VPGKDTDWTGWTVYFAGRALQLFGLLLATRAVFMSSASQLRVMFALTGAGVALFFVGWLLARNDPAGRR